MLIKVTSTSTRSARACDWVAKSVTAVRLYVALRSPLVVTAIVPVVPLRISRTIENSGGRGKHESRPDCGRNSGIHTSEPTYPALRAAAQPRRNQFWTSEIGGAHP